MFPKGQSFFYRVLGTVKPASRNSLTDERFLIRTRMYFHAPKRRSQEEAVPAKHCFTSAECTLAPSSENPLFLQVRYHHFDDGVDCLLR